MYEITYKTGSDAFGGSLGKARAIVCAKSAGDARKILLSHNINIDEEDIVSVVQLVEGTIIYC